MKNTKLVCPWCGYSLMALSSSICPECGESFSVIKPLDLVNLNQRTWFVLATRVIGVWLLITSAQYAWSVLMVVLGVDTGRSLLKLWVATIIENTAVAVYLLFGAEHLARFVFDFSYGRPPRRLIPKQTPSEPAPSDSR